MITFPSGAHWRAEAERFFAFAEVRVFLFASRDKRLVGGGRLSRPAHDRI
jgi:hypothetical protein